MIVKVTVKRGAGTHPAPDIVDTLLSGSTAAAKSRGNALLDAQGTRRERVTVEIVPQTGLEVNTLAEIVELDTARWRGLIDGVRFEIAARAGNGQVQVSRSCTVEMERELK